MTKDVIELVVTKCPYCLENVTTKWTKDGCVSDKEYVLIASWAMHATCFDKMYAESEVRVAARRLMDD